MKLILLILFMSINVTHTQIHPSKKLSKPEKNFELFWSTFRDHYAFFKLKNINWDSMYSLYRPLVTRKTKEKELIAILAQLVEPLRDGHITISKGEEILYKVKKSSYFKQEFKGLEKEFWENTNKTLTNLKFNTAIGHGPLFKNENLYYSTSTKDIAYIRISRCFANPESIFDDSKEMQDTKLMLSIFDSILTSLSDSKYLIIDLRANGGGHAGIELASRFVMSRSLTHYKAIRQKGDYENFTPLEPQYIEPNQGIRYLGQVIILTNDKTASSAEDFTISLYQQENITTIGTNTSGMLSDMYGAELPNKISFTLSNQRYYSLDKQLLEDQGVPARIEIKNSKTDIVNGIDPVLIKALEFINNHIK